MMITKVQIEPQTAEPTQVQSRSQMLRWLVDTAPQNVPLTDDDILNEIKQVRKNHYAG
jgi:hypothetical protein